MRKVIRKYLKEENGEGEMVKVLWIFEDYFKTQQWLKDELDLYFKVLKIYLEATFLIPVEFKRTASSLNDYDYMFLLITGILDHPVNTVANEPGWMDSWKNKVGYASVYEPQFYWGLAAKFKFGSPFAKASWHWEAWNGWKISHEIGHLCYFILNQPDKVHDFLPWMGEKPWESNYVYLDEDGSNVGKGGNWEVIFQRLK